MNTATANTATANTATATRIRLTSEAFPRVSGGAEPRHWFNLTEETESVSDDGGYGRRTYHGARGTGRYYVTAGDMGGLPYSGGLAEVEILAAVEAVFPEYMGKIDCVRL